MQILVILLFGNAGPFQILSYKMQVTMKTSFTSQAQKGTCFGIDLCFQSGEKFEL